MKKTLCVFLTVVIMAGIVSLTGAVAPIKVFAESAGVSDTVAQIIGNIDVGSSAIAQGYLGVVLSLIYAPMAIAAACPALVDIAAPVIALPAWTLAAIMLIPLLAMSAIN